MTTPTPEALAKAEKIVWPILHSTTIPAMQMVHVVALALDAERRAVWEDVIKRLNGAIRKDTDMETMDALNRYLDELRARAKEISPNG